MNNAQRENLKSKIEADLKLLIEECWLIDVKESLQEVLSKLEAIQLEGYDD